MLYLADIMANWKPLAEEKANSLWDYVHSTLRFNPYGKKGAVIALPAQAQCIDLDWLYGAGFSQTRSDNLQALVLTCLQQVSKDALIFALDWQHECFSFQASLPFELDEFDEWLIPAVPNGDLTFFLFEDLQNGIFGDGFNNQLCFFGEQVLEILKV